MSDDFFGLPTHINGEQAPYEIHGPMYGHFSIARHYGGCKAFGTDYVWVQEGDDVMGAILVRSDLWKARNKAAKAAKRAKKKATADAQQKLV